MRFTSPSRRALGLAAASTIGMSTALLGVTGIASAAPTPTWTFNGSQGTVTVPDGICAIDVVAIGGAGGAASDGSPGDPGGRLEVEDVDVQPGDVLELYVGAAGGAGGTAGGTGGASTYADFAGSAGEDDGNGVFGGGGGSMTGIVVVDDEYGDYSIAEAFGGDGGGDGGGFGSGFQNYASADDGTYSQTATSTSAPSISGTGVACVADAPYLNYVTAGNGSATVGFVAPQSDNGIAITGYEVTTNNGSSWAPLTVVTDENGTSGTITGLTNETTYTVAVRAVGGTNNELKGAASQSQSVTPYVPLPAPTNVSVTTTTSRITVTWTAPAGQVKGYDVGVSYGQSGDQGCAITDPSVTTCTFFAPAGSDYTVGVRAIDMQDRPGLSATRPGVTVPGPVKPTAVPTQDNGDIVGPSGPISKITAGQTLTLQGSGYAPNSTVELLVFSSPVSLGTVVTDENGSFSVEVTVPANLANGTHHLVATGVDANGNVRNLVITVTVSGGVATLATTGFDAVPVAVGGGLVLLTGAGLLVGARRRSDA
ncbi:fibronectin type III domain-containing protein [Klenkia taihuensis]|uniref:Fibronectin type III domain-containing protein n=1 Tax=Klenkia taihuensis TaxID=1225127 RepID=A0A1I1P323_9ACTN|nr:fibronectin type III domain-containing protein [Klenkia taihuensis]GHE11628.1 hypothetical protein GCM10011381_25830 [Klenkia taihuensis]SFD02088.1 Fibronectin type III domain-containing protein [Klenkia taihuensis]